MVKATHEGGLSLPSIDRAILSAAGFTIEAGLTESADDEAKMKQALIAAAAEVVAVLDHTKLGRVAPVTFCPTDRMGLLVTDTGVRRAMLAQLVSHGVRVHVAQIDAVD